MDPTRIIYMIRTLLSEKLTLPDTMPVINNVNPVEAVAETNDYDRIVAYKVNGKRYDCHDLNTVYKPVKNYSVEMCDLKAFSKTHQDNTDLQEIIDTYSGEWKTTIGELKELIKNSKNDPCAEDWQEIVDDHKGSDDDVIIIEGSEDEYMSYDCCVGASIRYDDDNIFVTLTLSVTANYAYMPECGEELSALLLEKHFAYLGSAATAPARVYEYDM